MEAFVAISATWNTIVFNEVCEAASTRDAQEFEVRIEFIHAL